MKVMLPISAMQMVGCATLFFSFFYVYYLVSINSLSVEPFTRPEELLFSFNMQLYIERPSDFIKSFLTVTHFWLLVSAIISYFVLLSKLFNPFPRPDSSGIYIFMLDANKLHILKLKETYSKLFVWHNKAYFLPKETLRYGNSTVLVYLSNINVAVNMLKISKEDVEMMVKTLVNYVYSYKSYTNKISKNFPIWPRDVLKRNYQIFVNMDEGTIEIYHSAVKGSYKVSRFVSADVFFVKNENVTKLDETNMSPSLVLGELEIPLITSTSIGIEGKSVLAKLYKTKLAKVYSYIDYGMSITNPYLTYDILKSRRVVINLYKYFVGNFTNRVLPLVLILMIIILLVLFFPQLQSMITPSPQAPLSQSPQA